MTVKELIKALENLQEEAIVDLISEDEGDCSDAYQIKEVVQCERGVINIIFSKQS